MYYLRRKQDGQYLYYISGDSYSNSSKLKDAIAFNELACAKEMKKQVEYVRNEKYEIVSVVSTLTVIPELKDLNNNENPNVE